MFFTETQEWAKAGAAITEAIFSQHADTGLGAGTFGLVLVSDGAPGPQGFAYRGDWRCYPCSLVKVFHLVHALDALDTGRLNPHAELDRALRDMILWSSNTATNYVIDLLTNTTGDTLLSGAEYMDWTIKRGRLNSYFTTLGWPEFATCNLVQKLMDDTRYGREAQFAGVNGENLNALTPLASARLMWELFSGNLPIAAPLRHRAQAILRRDPSHQDAANPNYQLCEYLGGALPEGAEIWSKAGHNLWTGDANASWFKHDMIRFSSAGRKPLVAVVMSQGQGVAETYPQVFPAIGRLIWNMTEDLCRISG